MNKTETEGVDSLSEDKLRRLYDCLDNLRRDQLKIFRKLKRLSEEVDEVLKKEPSFQKEFQEDLKIIREIIRARARERAKP